MSCLDAVVDTIGKRLTWLGIDYRSLPLDAARIRVPIVSTGISSADPPGSRHLLLELPPVTLIVSIYEVSGGDVSSRDTQLEGMAAALAAATPGPPARALSWSHSFFDQGIDLFIVFFGLEVPSERWLRERVAAIASPATIDALGRVVARGNA